MLMLYHACQLDATRPVLETVLARQVGQVTQQAAKIYHSRLAEAQQYLHQQPQLVLERVEPQGLSKQTEHVHSLCVVAVQKPIGKCHQMHVEHAC